MTMKPKRRIFVFGSNLAGRHGAGSALEAVQSHGAIYGQGWGPQGNSWGIPTKDARLRVMSLGRIRPFVELFIAYATTSPEVEFDVCNIGCGLAGYRPEQIAPMFKDVPSNVHLSEEFEKHRND